MAHSADQTAAAEDAGESSNFVFTMIALITVMGGAILAAFGLPLTFAALAAAIGLGWGAAVLALRTPDLRHALAESLSHPTYTQTYQRAAGRLLDTLWTAFDTQIHQSDSWPRVLRASLGWRLYDAALLFTTAAPILLFLGQWIVLNHPMAMAGERLAPPAPFWPDRGIALFPILVVTVGLLARRLAADSLRPFWQRLADPMFVAAALLAALAAATGAAEPSVVVPATIVTALVFAPTVSGALVATTALAAMQAYADTVVQTRVLPFAVSALILLRNVLKRPALARWLLTLATLPALAVLAIFILPEPDAEAVFVLLGLLPVPTAAFIFFACGLSLSIAARGFRSRLPWAWALADFGLGFGLFLALSVMLTVLAQGLNLLARNPVVDLAALFADLRDPQGTNLWLLVVPLGTLLPATLHVGASLTLGLQGILPPDLRAWLGRRIVPAPRSVWHLALQGATLAAVLGLPAAMFIALGISAPGLGAVRAFLTGPWLEILGRIANVPVSPL